MANSSADTGKNSNLQYEKAMEKLFNELEAGIYSAEEEGWISEKDFSEHMRARKNKM